MRRFQPKERAYLKLVEVEKSSNPLPVTRYHGGAPRAFSRGRKKGAAREGECGRRASTVTSLLFNHKAEPALSPKVRVFSEENNGFGGLEQGI